jgi:hypothetical protein
LPRDQINHVVQDSHGYLWFCTAEGLSRFDGYRFTNYGKEQGLPDRRVNDFLETRDGVYWVATDEGLCRFIADPQPQPGGDGVSRFVFQYPDDNPRRLPVIVLFEGSTGTVWCGTSEGLYRLDKTEGRWIYSFVDITRPASKFDDSAVVGRSWKTEAAHCGSALVRDSIECDPIE